MYMTEGSRPSNRMEKYSQMNLITLLTPGLLVFLCALCTGCDRTSPSIPIDAQADQAEDVLIEEVIKPDKPTIKHLEGEAPGPDTVIAELGDVSVSVLDFERAANLGRLFGPEARDGKFGAVPPERLAIPTVQFTTVRAVLARKAILAEVTRRGISIDDKELRELYKSRPEYAGLAFLMKAEDLESALQELDISVDEFWSIGREQIARERLADALIGDLSETDIWQAYAFENTRVRVAAVTMSNVPTPQEIDAFVENETEAIEAFFHENERRFRNPQRIVIDMLSGDVSKLERALPALAAKSPEAVALEYELQLRSGVRMSRQENPKAFRAEPGESGIEVRGSPYIWRVSGREESTPSELNRPVSREIAAELLRTGSITPSAKQKLEKGQKLLRRLKDTEDSIVSTKSKLSELGLELHVLAPFTKSPAGNVPVFGLAPEFLEESFRLKVGGTSKPFLSRDRAFVVHVLQKEMPDKKIFEANKIEIRKAVEDELRPSAVDRFVQGFLGSSQLNLHPLGVKFGIIQKEP